MLYLFEQDQYVLKMHIKMVHMPTEVFFECMILICNVCLAIFVR